MIKAKSRVKLNMGVIKKLSTAAVTSLEQTADAVQSDLKQSQVMPFDKGTLQNTQTFVDYKESNQGRVQIVSSTPYARRLYYHPEYNFSTAENPNAGGKWFEDYLAGGKKQNFTRDTFKKLYKRNGGL